MILTHLILSGFTITWQGSASELLERGLTEGEKAYRIEGEDFPYSRTPTTLDICACRYAKFLPCRLVELEFYQEAPRTLVRPRKP